MKQNLAVIYSTISSWHGNKILHHWTPGTKSCCCCGHKCPFHSDKFHNASNVTRWLHYFSFMSMKICPMASKICQFVRVGSLVFGQIQKNWRKFARKRNWRYCQSSDISPNLVPLGLGLRAKKHRRTFVKSSLSIEVNWRANSVWTDSAIFKVLWTFSHKK